MILVGKETKKSAAQVLEQAVAFFGADGVGLEMVHQDDTNLRMQGGGGYVAVRALTQQDIGKTEVEIESREWESDAKRFLGKI
jgi:hypothetical protein